MEPISLIKSVLSLNVPTPIISEYYLIAFGITFAQGNKQENLNSLILELIIQLTAHRILMLFVAKKLVKIGAKNKEYASMENAITRKIISKAN
jgi:hypothetical protein